MKKINANKKGFTIVELVIVIAVIGVLAAILIPTFINLNNKANESYDKALERNLNTLVAAEKAKPEALEDLKVENAAEVAEAAGYLLDNLAARGNGNEFVWDEANDKFVLFNENDLAAMTAEEKANYYKFTNFGDKDFSLFLGKSASEVQNIEASASVSDPYGKAATINYVNKSGNHKDSTINANSSSTVVTIEAPLDDVTFKGEAGIVNAKEVAPSSLHVEGKIAVLEIGKGRAVLKEESKVSTVYLTANEDNKFNDIEIKLEENVELPELRRDSIGVELNEVVEVCTITTAAASETIYLEGNGTIEDAKVLVSATGNVADAVAVTEENASEAAKAVANAKVGDEVVDNGVQEGEKETVIENIVTEVESKEIIDEAGEEGADYVARIGKVGFDSLDTALATAKANDVVILMKDLEINGKGNTNAAIAITKSITLNGNGHTVTADAGRTIWIDSSDVNVTIKNLTTVNTCTYNSGYQRGIQVNTDKKNVYLNIENCDVTTRYYALNICAGTTVDIVVKKSTLRGWAAMNIWSNGVSIKAYDSKFISHTISAGEMFGAIVLEGDSTGLTPMHSSDMTVDLYNCEFDVGGSYYQTAIQFNNSSTGGAINNTVNLNNCNIKHDTPIGSVDENTPIYLVSYDSGTNNHINFDDASTFNGKEAGLVTIWSGKGVCAYEINE